MRTAILLALVTFITGISAANAIPISVGNPVTFSFTSPITGPYTAGQYDIVFSSVDPWDPGETINAQLLDSGMNLIGASSTTSAMNMGSYTGFLGLSLSNYAPSVPDIGFVVLSATTGSFDITSIGLFLIKTDTSARFDITGNLVNATPVPEPATLAIFAIGLAGLGAARRRRRTG